MKLKYIASRWPCRLFLLLLVPLCAACAGSGKDGGPPLQTVAFVNLDRYTGVWYEIARYPNGFQKDCADSQATYALRPDGKMSVLNECRDQTSGESRKAKGKAWVVDRASNAKLKVAFFWPFAGDYWIIDLGQEYEYAVIGHPERKYLWILSRDRQMQEEVYQGILHRLTARGYDIAKLLLTPQA